MDPHHDPGSLPTAGRRWPVEVQMLRVRQSSLVGKGRVGVAGWVQAGPKASALRTPDQRAGAWGGRQRRSPTGGAA